MPYQNVLWGRSRQGAVRRSALKASGAAPTGQHLQSEQHVGIAGLAGAIDRCRVRWIIRKQRGCRSRGGTSSMKKLALALLALPLAQSGVSAQTAGSAAAGKAYWERAAPRATACRNCHGDAGEGAFGPDLAGRGLNAAQVARAVHQPWGIMPAFVESQLSDQDAADLAAYFASLPKVAEPGKWRFEVPAGAPPGQANLINVGCAQCHGPTFNGPRNNIGAIDMDFDYFANLVYNHTTAM